MIIFLKSIFQLFLIFVLLWLKFFHTQQLNIEMMLYDMIWYFSSRRELDSRPDPLFDWNVTSAVLCRRWCPAAHAVLINDRFHPWNNIWGIQSRGQKWQRSAIFVFMMPYFVFMWKAALQKIHAAVADVLLPAELRWRLAVCHMFAVFLISAVQNEAPAHCSRPEQLHPAAFLISLMEQTCSDKVSWLDLFIRDVKQ